jgi:ligand-binding sensor domain-containing protein
MDMKICKHLSRYSIILGTMFLFTCSGQLKTKQQATISVEQAKLMMPHSSNEGDNVHRVIQDRTENLWFATTGNGVYRYDGKTFTNFTTKDGLLSNGVFAMLQDKTGKIWFGTDHGLSCFDGKTFSQIPITFNENRIGNFEKVQASNIFVNTILQDKKGMFWFASESGVFCYDGKEFTWFIDNPNIVNAKKINPKNVIGMIEDKKGNIWFTTRAEGVYCFDGSELVNYQPNNLKWFYSIFEDSKGNIWVGNRAGDGVYQFDGKNFTSQLTNLGLNEAVVYSMIQDNAGNIWFGTEADDVSKRQSTGGIWRYDGKKLKNFTTADGLSNNAIFTVFEDRNRHLWIGGRNTSLSKYDGKTFTKFW